jgi:hypothetical protein
LSSFGCAPINWQAADCALARATISIISISTGTITGLTMQKKRQKNLVYIRQHLRLLPLARRTYQATLSCEA